MTWILWGRRTAVAALAGVVLAGTVPGGAALGAEKKDEEREPGRWYPTAEAGLNFTQSAYSDNWYGGDKGSIVWTALFNGSLENQIHPQVNWFTMLKLAFGQTHQQVTDSEGNRAWDKPEKSTDLIDLESIFRFTFGGYIDPYFSVRFESQFLDASDPAGRNLTLNPLKFRQSAGIARKFIGEEDRSLLSRFGFTFREAARRQFVNPAPDPETATETTVDGGLEWTTDYQTKILEERVTWTSKLVLFQPVFFSGKDELEELGTSGLAEAGLDADLPSYTTTLDVDWENIFTTQITKIISVNLYLRWVYDKYDNSVLPKLDESGALQNADQVRQAVRKAGQFKQTLGIGVTYRFL